MQTNFFSILFTNLFSFLTTRFPLFDQSQDCQVKYRLQ